MKLLILMVLLISTTANSQIKTGGGTLDPYLGGDSFARGDHGHGEMIFSVVDFIARLKHQEAFCRRSGQRYLDIDSDLVNVYMKLSVMKVSFLAANRCQELKEFFDCLSTPQVRTSFEALATRPDFPIYLMKKYNMTESEVGWFVNFFRGMNLVCQREIRSCEVQGF